MTVFSIRGARSWRHWRLLRSGWCRALEAFVLLLQSGCYVYSPVFGGQPVPGNRYEMQITDRGRIDVADRLGPGVESVEGTLLETRDGTFQVRVASVKTIGAPRAHWGGEKVTIPESAVARLLDRRLSKGRTVVAIGAAVAGVGTFIVTRGLFGFGPADDSQKPAPPVDQ